MALKTALLMASSIAASVMGTALNNRDECGAPEPTEEHKAITKQLLLNETMFADNEFSAKANINVPVHVHIVARDKTPNGGYAKETDIRNTIAGMNKHYSNMGFQYILKNIDYTINAEWSSNKGEYAMKEKLREGDYKTLNLYYIPTLDANGYCYLPIKTPDAASFIKDGCTIRTDKMTNGQTTTHEVGHWLGLYHTFQGECGGSGDQVDDTPACKKTWSCNDNQDTCPGRPGKDPVHNFMSYGTCRREFTVGQGKRMRSSYDYYRK
ncbi:metalloprotease [Pochonia chlamydosporia 170]|uniref:Metalloprotease n=1 Tax=Pochonia chlamydosporia 170 TaxID=1380566 RepID=A0A179G3G6_METCM|nr:metalloprotease [Pochonia chlamydosporia 170]OAQ71913.1 metalloprotease [Pochonia chlamydosporia 170]